MGYDLNQIEMRCHAEAGVDFPIRHPQTRDPILDEAGNQVQINMSGGDAERIKSLIEERDAKRRAQAVDAEQKGEPAPVIGWETREADLIEDIVLLTNGWTDNLELDGKPYPFSKANAAVLYKRFPDILIQMRDNAAGRFNFLPISASK